MSFVKPKYLIILPLLLAAMPAQAYIGPGMGAGAISVVLGVLASIFLAFLAVLWYPFKRLLKQRKKRSQVNPGEASDPS